MINRGSSIPNNNNNDKKQSRKNLPPMHTLWRRAFFKRKIGRAGRGGSVHVGFGHHDAMMTPRPHLPPPQTTRPPSIRRHLLSFSPKTEKRIFSGGCSFRDVFFPRTLDFSCFSGDRFIFIFFSFAAATARSEGGKRDRENRKPTRRRSSTCTTRSLPTDAAERGHEGARARATKPSRGLQFCLPH